MENENPPVQSNQNIGQNDPQNNPQNGQPMPAAYDIQGRPLYYAPPPAGAPGYGQQGGQPGQAATALGQVASGQATQSNSSGNGNSRGDQSDEEMQRSEQSKKQYPQLNLSDGEYIVAEVKRHPFGILQIWLIAFTLIATFAALLYGYMSSQGSGSSSLGSVVPIAISGLALISIFVVIGAIVASYVYNNNKFYLTNESVIQEIQESLFGKHEQTVNLGRIEDASYFQSGILPNIFNYGRIRLSTVGDESTYQFNYVENPKKILAELNNEIERYKGMHH
jgi:uncharacterized membrane protein YdbT with pleckstrin-like domain